MSKKVNQNIVLSDIDIAQAIVAQRREQSGTLEDELSGSFVLVGTGTEVDEASQRTIASWVGTDSIDGTIEGILACGDIVLVGFHGEDGRGTYGHHLDIALEGHARLVTTVIEPQ